TVLRREGGSNPIPTYPTISLIITLTSLNAVEDNDCTIEKSSDNQNIEIEKSNQNMKTDKEVKTSSKTIVLNSTNFNNYVTDKQFNENVSDGDTIDIQGKLDGSKFSLDIAKPVNIISSNNAYINLHTGEYLNYGESERGILRILSTGAGTNITGIQLHNTRLSIENTHDVTINNISCIDENAAIGQNVGAVSIREGSENITITNSYFKTLDNGGHSNVVFAVAYNCLFENNTIEGYCNGHTIGIGNLLYLTTFNVDTTNIIPHNVNITIRNNIIKSYNVSTDLNICWALVLEGYGHVIENNIINHSNVAVTGQYSDPEYGSETELGEMRFTNNTIYGGTSGLAFPGIVANNTFYDTAGISKAECSNNRFTDVNIGSNIYFHDNTANHLKIIEDNNTVDNNTFFTDKEYAITILGENNTVSNNSIGSINGRGEAAINNTTNYININNDKPAIFVITGENKDAYVEPITNPRGIITGYSLKDNKFIDNDSLILNVTVADISPNRISDPYNYYGDITLNLLNSSGIVFNVTNTRVINSQVAAYVNIEAYNSFISGCGNVIYSENSYIYDKGICPNENQVLLYNKNIRTLANENIQENQELIIIKQYNTPLNITIPVNITGKYQETNISTFTNNVTFNEGSQNTNVTNCSFAPAKSIRTIEINTDELSFSNCLFLNSTVIINGNNINFTNCTFDKELTLNDTSSINIINCTFNTQNTPITVYNSARITIENNTINTTSPNTLIFDEDSDKTIFFNRLFYTFPKKISKST
ncbi:MAG: hypothetical protein Q4Q22_09045, partial [Methanosphaera sp.]|nr:hypothetical protein [Methanosphaera sp.]